jgi:hypothetical protein
LGFPGNIRVVPKRVFLADNDPFYRPSFPRVAIAGEVGITNSYRRQSAPKTQALGKRTINPVITTIFTSLFMKLQHEDPLINGQGAMETDLYASIRTMQASSRLL